MAQKRSTNKAQQRGQAAQAKVTNAEETVAPVVETPSRKAKRLATGYHEAAAAGVAVPTASKTSKTVIPKPAVPAKPRGKTAAKNAVARTAAQTTSEENSAKFLEQGRASGEVSILRNLAINEHAKHVKMIEKMKKKFPAVPAIQALQPKTLSQITQELAQQPKPVSHIKMTPKKQENFELNKSLTKNVDINTNLQMPLASLNSTVELPGYEAEKRKPAGLQAAKKAVPYLVAQANKLPKQSI